MPTNSASYSPFSGGAVGISGDAGDSGMRMCVGVRSPPQVGSTPNQRVTERWSPMGALQLRMVRAAVMSAIQGRAKM